MTAVVHLTRFLLGCLISEITSAAALPTGHGKTPELWPPLHWGPQPPTQSWGQPVVPTWQPPGVWNVPNRKPLLLQNPTAVRNTEGHVPPETPQKRIPVATPRTFQIKFQAPEDRRMGQNYFQSKDSQGSSEPGFQFSLSVPIPTTTVAPKAQKPLENKVVSFFSGLLAKGQSNQNDKTSTQTQQNQVFFKPDAHQHPTNYWMGKMHSHSTDSGSGAQNPVHQTVQNVHYSPQWFPLTSSDNADVRNSILQSAKYVNGQLMIPLEKCPGFEKFAAFLHHHGHHHHGHHRHHGHDQHHHGHHHHHGHDQHHQHHGHHHGQHHQHHGQHHQHHGHHHGQHHQHHGQHHQPHHTKFFLNMEGSAPNPKEVLQGKDVLQSETENPFRRWHSDKTSGQFFNPMTYSSYVPDSQQSIVKPGQTNYMVQLGGNVEYEKQPDAQSHNHFHHVQQRNPY
ncbi:hypothetical protein NQD34_004521 [Periophthalmus magnuspinnatus]|nr:hypothetical protein NQD34_004521 [Periophthalmus magnuspinnatus]